MQPEQPTQDFQPPEETNYFSPEPGEAASPPAAEALAPAERSTPEVPQETTPTANEEVLQWQASEYIHRQKSPGWFVVFGVVVVALIAVAIFLKAWTFAILIPVMAAALLAYAHRPPQIMNYALSPKGLYINDTLHGFAEFKGFGVIHEYPEEFSVELIPVRRFRPRLSVNFPENRGEAIVDILGVRLPMQPVKPDVFDKIVRALGL